MLAPESAERDRSSGVVAGAGATLTGTAAGTRCGLGAATRSRNGGGSGLLLRQAALTLRRSLDTTGDVVANFLWLVSATACQKGPEERTLGVVSGDSSSSSEPGSSARNLRLLARARPETERSRPFRSTPDWVLVPRPSWAKQVVENFGLELLESVGPRKRQKMPGITLGRRSRSLRPC